MKFAELISDIKLWCLGGNDEFIVEYFLKEWLKS